MTAALLAWALIIVAGWVVAVGFLALAVWFLSRLCEQQRMAAQEELDTEEHLAEIRAVRGFPEERWASYSTTRTPVALRALAARAAEDADRLEAQQTARIAVQP